MRTPKNEPTACPASGASYSKAKLPEGNARPCKATCTCTSCPQHAAIRPLLPQGTRRMKVQPKFVRRTWDATTVPQIVLSGHWLRAIGFEPQGYILIEARKGKLVIRVEKEP